MHRSNCTWAVAEYISSTSKVAMPISVKPVVPLHLAPVLVQMLQIGMAPSHLERLVSYLPSLFHAFIHTSNFRCLQTLHLFPTMPFWYSKSMATKRIDSRSSARSGLNITSTTGMIPKNRLRLSRLSIDRSKCVQYHRKELPQVIWFKSKLSSSGFCEHGASMIVVVLVSSRWWYSCIASFK